MNDFFYNRSRKLDFDVRNCEDVFLHLFEIEYIEYLHNTNMPISVIY